MPITSSLTKWGAAVLLLSSLTSCEDVLEQYFPKPDPTPTFPSLGLDIPFYTLSGGTQLDAFSTKSPATRTSSVAITGLQNGEKLLAIDFRPATGQLYGVSSTSRIYVINQNTGAARAIGTGPFTPAVQGNLVGFDFNPTVDRIRLVTNTGQNLRLNPETGTVAATDGSINGVPGANVTGAAYTNNTAGASTTALYAINTQNQQLYLVNPPNDGTLVPIGSLNLNISGDGGFDIDAKTGTALGLYTVQGKPTLFSVNLSTGAARPLAQYAANAQYVGIAIPTQPVAYAIRSGRSRIASFNDLLIFNPNDPSTAVVKPMQINTSGFSLDVVLLGLDFRPANGQLYAVGDNGSLYTINTASGVATEAAILSVRLDKDGTGTDEVSPLGFDFNPVVDRIRIVTNTGQSLRVNPADGVAIEDGRLNSAPVNAAAYDNNFVGSTATNLYVIDYQSDKLFLQSPPNNGTLVEIGNLGIDVEAVNNFDIGGTSNTGYATLTIGGITQLYTISKSTGAATASSTIDLRTILPIIPTSFGYSVNGFTIGLGF